MLGEVKSRREKLKMCERDYEDEKERRAGGRGMQRENVKSTE